MWNSRKKDEEAAARAAATPPVQSDYGNEAIPASTYATRPSEFSNTRAVATIGKSLVMKGQIRGQEDLVIEGRLEGDVDLPEHRLTIGVSGQVQGSVRAREIVILGTVQGNLEASERVEIKRNAKVIGDLKAQRPVIEDEAYFKGNVETIRVDKTAQKPAAPPPIVEPQGSLLTDSKPEIRKG